MALRRETALEGLTFFLNVPRSGVSASNGVRMGLASLESRLEERGAVSAKHRDASVDVVVCALDAPDVFARRGALEEAHEAFLGTWRQKPRLRSDDLVDFLLDEPVGRAGPADALFAYVRMLRELEAASDVSLEVRKQDLGGHGREFLWETGWLFDLYRSRFPLMRPAHLRWLGMVPCCQLSWRREGEDGGLRLSPQLEVRKGVLRWVCVHKLDNACPHMVLNSFQEGAEAAVFRGEGESDEVFFWDHLEPEVLTPMAADIWEFLLMASRHWARRGWMRDVTGRW